MAIQSSDGSGTRKSGFHVLETPWVELKLNKALQLILPKCFAIYDGFSKRSIQYWVYRRWYETLKNNQIRQKFENLNQLGFNPIIELISGTSKNPISGTRLHRSLLWRKPKFKSADVIDAYNDIIHGGLNNFVFWKCKKNVLLFLNDLKMSWTDWVYFFAKYIRKQFNFFKGFLLQIIWYVLPWMFTFFSCFDGSK